ncbi:MAG TPA: HAD family hydrolase [Thermoanaerobaculia bacterium]|nr:HAD family hydrolase [Thermoanaerobaculia bacterium]
MSPPFIFLDLDGTVLDVLPRYHRLHCDAVRRAGGEPLDEGEYWQAKREGIPELDLLARTGLAPPAAARAAEVRLRRIESRRYLALDRLWPWTETVLNALARIAPLVLVTLRHHPGRLGWQLGRLGLSGSFERVVAGGGDGTPEAKARLLRDAGLGGLEGSVLVGDTEVDIASGRALGLRTIALRCGIRSPASLAPWDPDLLLDDLRQVPDVLMRIWAQSWEHGGDRLH